MCHLAILTLEEIVFITIVCHTVQVHHALDHELGEVQFWLASDIQTASDEILSSVVEPEALYVAGLVSHAPAFSIGPEHTLF